MPSDGEDKNEPDSAITEDKIRRIVESRMHPIIRDEIAHEESQRFRQIKWIIAFVGIVGLGTFGTLANYLIEEAVDSKLENRAGKINEALGFIKFQALANKLELNTSFSDKDRDAIMNYLRDVQSNDDQRHSAEFLAALHQVTSSFASASQSAQLDEIYAIYRSEILSEPVLVESLLHHYGQELVGRVHIPQKDIALMTFEALERVAASSRVPELALYYRVLYEHQQLGDGRNELVAKKLARLKNMKEADIARFFSELFRSTRVSNWQLSPTASGKKIEQLARNFISAYGEDFVSEFNFDADLPDLISANGVGEDDVTRLAFAVVNGIGGEGGE
ncbi:hypothetical protein [uncultured Halomonas sp.]|uniref:hypothetical protein n=1 Tax=uncultured Halomonas sp. TaxID=173971 RepID=UPI002605879F|nr:hypothetical protein [uncultured Halomonas sp.]